MVGRPRSNGVRQREAGPVIQWRAELEVRQGLCQAGRGSRRNPPAGEAGKAEGDFQKTIKSLFAVAEAYPDLKASQNFQQLQMDLTDTEDKIQASRRFYNGVVRDFNTKRKVFPTNIFANMLGFKQDKEFFELGEAETAAVQKPVDVEF